MDTSSSYTVPLEMRNYREGYGPFSSRTVTGFTVYQRRTRNSNPNWKDQVANKTNATTPYARFDSRFKSLVRTHASYRCTINGIPAQCGFVGHYWGGVYSSPFAKDTVSSKAINEALGRFLHQIGQRNSPLKGGIVIGEMKKTLKMIYRPFRAVFDLCKSYLLKYRSAVKGRVLRRIRGKLYWLRRSRLTGKPTMAGMIDARKFLANLWLEYSFGLKPLLSDIESGLTAYRQYVDNPQGAEAIWGTGRDEGLVSDTPFDETISQGIWLVGNRRITLDHSVKFVGEYGYRLSPQQGNVDRALWLCGFRPEEFVPTLWELLPFSWLVDYFSNVGQILESLTVATGNVLWYCRSDRVIRRNTQTSRMNWGKTKLWVPAGAFAAADVQGLIELETISFSRTVPPLGVPGFVFEIPGMPTQWLNMVAVLQNLTRR